MGTKKTSKSDFYLSEFEKRFQKVSGISEDLSKFPLHHSLDTSVETNKSKSKEFGEVFTPLWLVDEMIKQVSTTKNSHTLDLCAGYGQFSIRLLRKLRKQNINFDCIDFLKNRHSFSELQLSSCYKLIHTFSTCINLFIGDSKELPSLPGIASGIWVYIESMSGWVPLTNTVKAIMYPNLPEDKKPISPEKFVNQLQEIINKLNKAFEMNEQEKAKIHAAVNYNSQTRLHFLKLINGDMNAEHPDDKHISTPVSIVDNMLACVDHADKKQILVLFNAEIVERLIHSKKVPAANITFGVDDQNKLRALFVKKTYDVDCVVFPEKDAKSIVQALGTKKWDVVLSNPPYNAMLIVDITQRHCSSKCGT